jgi:hypothetical protein
MAPAHRGVYTYQLGMVFFNRCTRPVQSFMRNVKHPSPILITFPQESTRPEFRSRISLPQIYCKVTKSVHHYFCIFVCECIEKSSRPFLDVSAQAWLHHFLNIIRGSGGDAVATIAAFCLGEGRERLHQGVCVVMGLGRWFDPFVG